MTTVRQYRSARSRLGVLKIKHKQTGEAATLIIKGKEIKYDEKWYIDNVEATEKQALDLVLTDIK